MSNVFRSQNTVTNEGTAKRIRIRDLSPIDDLEPEENLTMERIYFERDRLMEEARRTIQADKLSIENLRTTVSEDIAAMQQAWETEKKVLEQKAYEEGFQVGYEEGRNKAISEMTASIALANQTTERSHENALKYIKEQERVILELAIRSAERIIGQTIEADEDKFLSVVRRGIKEVREMKEIKLYVSTMYFELISDNREELAAIFPPEVPFLIFVNEEFDSTDCYIETNHGRIIVTIDEQLNELREQLLEIMEGGD